MKKNTLILLAALSFGLIITSTVIFTRPPQTVVFDIKGTLESYQEKLMEAGVNDEEHRQRLAQFDKNLRRILDDYAQAHHLTIVVPAAVISGAPDMTAALQNHVIEEIKRHQQ